MSEIDKKFLNDGFKIIDGIYSFEVKDNTTNLVSNFYDEAPFPHYDKKENKDTILAKGNANIIASQLKKNFSFNKNILEVGSGTSQLSNYLAIGSNNKIFALDATFNSLKLGKDFSLGSNIKNVTFVHSDLFSDTFKDAVFDVVWCSGVLHHTKNPYKGFQQILKYLKDDGYVIVGLYNKIFRFKTFFLRQMSKIFGKKIIYFFDSHQKKISTEKEKKNSWIEDQYFHPVESMHTFDEVLGLFKKNNIEFINSIPSCNPSYQKKNIFDKVNKGDYFTRILSQFFSIFSSYGSEGGLFIFIGKKIK